VHVKQRMMVPFARFAPVTATAALSGLLVCEAVCTVLVERDCPQPLLCPQLKEPLTLSEKRSLFNCRP